MIVLQDNGQRDSSFGPGLNGLTTIDSGGSSDFATGIAVDGAGRVLVSGLNNESVVRTFILARLSPNGSLDSSFAVGGVASNPIDPQGSFYANSGVIATADGIVVGGYGGDAGTGAARTVIARYLH